MKPVFVFSLIILVFLPGCKKADKLTQFHMEFNETVIIPSTAGINLPFNIFTPDVKSNSESTFATNGTRRDLVEDIKLTTLELTHASPSHGNFGFLKSIEIFISAEGLSEVRVAWKENIPSTAGKYLALETTDANLKEFIKKDAFTLRCSTVTDELLAEDQHIDIHSVFFVDARILGQ